LGIGPEIFVEEMLLDKQSMRAWRKREEREEERYRAVRDARLPISGGMVPLMSASTNSLDKKTLDHREKIAK